MTAGLFQVFLTASNAVGVGSSVLHLHVLDTGSVVVREVWTGVNGTRVADIPLATPPAITEQWGSLQVLNYGDNYGQRIRGHLTAPFTANYYFWLAASDSAELWISTDSEPINKVLRAYVLPNPNPAPPPDNGTGPEQWNVQSSQRSPWLSLEAGQRYYFEVLHKAGQGTNDNLAVGWAQDAVGTSTQPSELVPSYVLSPYYQPPLSFIPGTLYSANMLSQAGSGGGTATLRVSADGTSAVLRFQYSGLSSAVTAAHIHSDPYLNHPGQIIFDIDSATPQADGSYIWTIDPLGTLSAAEILEILREGKAYINVHTVNFPGGEIRGNFTMASGSQTFTPPPPALAWTDDHANSNAAVRFLIQATFGPGPDDIAAVQSMGYEAWIDDQFTRPSSPLLPYVLAHPNSDPTIPYPNTSTRASWWQQSVTAPDQLRQRVAFALSEIMVVSDDGVLDNNARALCAYYDVLLEHAFGNFRDLLEAVTLSPAMGNYLDMRGNDKGNVITGRHPNENYAREVLQLFSIGLYKMWPDGTLMLDSEGNLIPTYDQKEILGYARLFTGWTYSQTNRANGRLPTNFAPPSNYIDPMKLVPTHHELGEKEILNDIVLPPASGAEADSTLPESDAYGSRDLDLGLDAIFYHRNVGPFICRQLIQRLVTSHPSREYLYRVVQKFNDNGAGVRGDMQAVLKAILLDYEARSSTLITQLAYGKQREPLLRATALARALAAPAALSGTYVQDGTRVTTITTTTPHRLNNNDSVFLTFTSGTPLPSSQSYTVGNATPLTFTVNSAGTVSATYGWTNDVLTVISATHGLVVSNWVYLVFLSGPASSGAYQVESVPSTGRFTVSAPGGTATSGNCLYPRLTGGYRQSGTNITVSTSVNHGLNVGDPVYINFTSGSAADGQYTVTIVTNDRAFTVAATNSVSQTQISQITYPLVAPQLVRSGDVAVSLGTWLMGSTDSELGQTPLNSPTVFNFFFPDYKFPGPLSSAGLTTPEFQLTSDTTVVSLMNFMQAGLLNGANTNGLMSFKNQGGAVFMDIGPWMGTNYTSNAGIPSLVDALNTRLCAGQLSSAARTTIINYVNTLPYGAPPSNTQRRDRVRAALHLIATSPDFSIQR